MAARNGRRVYLAGEDYPPGVRVRQRGVGNAELRETFGAEDGPARDPRLAPGSVQRAPGREWDQYGTAFRDYTKIPAQYVARVTLNGAAGTSATAAVKLRPEPFLLKRITWAAVPIYDAQNNNFSAYDTGQSIELKWGDEFVKFLGDQPGLLQSLFGSPFGFLDLTREALFNGNQTLSAEFRRLVPTLIPTQQQVELVFHGTGLLPRGMQQSGSL
jgi:hypothetical protein